MARTKSFARKSTSGLRTIKNDKKNEKIDAEERSDDTEDIENEENGVENKEIQKNGHENGVKSDSLTNGSINTPKSRGRPKKITKEDDQNGIDENNDEKTDHVNGKSSPEANGHENGTETKSSLQTNGSTNTPKSRGRPKKVIQEDDDVDVDQTKDASVVNGKSDASATPKSRGRPKKVLKEDDQNGNDQENEAEITENENSNAKTSLSETKEEQKNGKENATESGGDTAPKSRGRPRKVVDDDEEKVNQPTTPKPRGRPKKVVSAENETNGHDNETDKKSDLSSNDKNSKVRPKKAANVMIDLDDKSDEEEDEDDDENEPEENETNGHDNDTQTKSGLLSECQKLFGTNDLYSVLNLKKTCEAAEIKKAYYKFSLKYHPDKTEESIKDENKAKFQLLCQVYSILSDVEKRKIYDECGAIDGENDLFTSDKDWSDYWRTMFKKITKEDVDKFFQEYRNSDEERADLLTLYEKHKGDIDLISQEFFSQDLLEDEPRMRKIIMDAIEKGDATAYDIFTNESKRKASKRKAMLQSEAKEAEQMRKKMGIDDSEESLKALILNRQKQRETDFLNHLTEKYVNKKQTKKPTKTAKRTSEPDEESDENDKDASSGEEDDYDPASKRIKIPRTATGGKKTKKIKRL